VSEKREARSLLDGCQHEEHAEGDYACEEKKPHDK
jgi:hypothetical protein